MEWYKVTDRNFSVIPEKSGVYIISTLQKVDNKYAVNYVGQSKNLHERIVKHFSPSEENEQLKKHLAMRYGTKVNWAYVDESQLDGVEHFLCRCFKNLFNKNTPPGEKNIECNLPDVRSY